MVKSVKTKEKKFKLGPIQKAWVRALRSGKYKQCDGKLTALRTDGKVSGHCCLGVLCEVAIKRGVSLETEDILDNTTSRRDYDGEGRILPKKVQLWIGAIDDNPTGEDGNGVAELNDEGKSFKYIAKFIEKNASSMFEEPR